MRAFRKVFAVLIVFSLLLSGISANAASRDIPKEACRLVGLGYLDAAELDANSAQMSKALFVKTAVRMYLSGSAAPYYAAVDFQDVTPGGFAASEIQFALKAGLIEKAEYFSPESAMSYDEAVRIVVKILGYGIVAESEGYIGAAMKAKALRGVNAKFELKDALTLLDNALESPLMKPIAFGDEYTMAIDENNTLLTQSGIDIIKAGITEVDVWNSRITANGTTYLTENIDLSVIPEGSAKLYVRNSDNIVLYIDVMGDTKIVYDFIEYVNNRQDKYAMYPSDIEKITFRNSGETFRVEDDANITLNEKAAAGTYIDTFAKIIIKNDQIAKVEAYTLRAGGLIYRADTQEIKYSTGKMAENVISGFDQVKELEIYVDGVRSSNMLNLKADMVFDFWCNQDESRFLIVASSRTAEGRFESYSTNSIFVDGIEYEMSGANPLVAQSYLTKKYSDREDYRQFLSNAVKIYIDDNKYVRFIEIDESLSEINEFYGVVLGVKATNNLDDTYEVKVHKITGGAGEAIYQTASRLHADSLSMDYVASVAKDYDGRGFLKFMLNHQNEIKKVEVPEYWGSTATTNDLEDVGNTHRIGGVPVKNATMFALFEADGQFTVQHITWENIRGRRTSNGSQMRIVSDFDIRYNPLPRFVALTENCQYLCSYYTTLDVLDGISQLPDDKVRLKFAGGSRYITTMEFVTANKLSERCFVRYRDKKIGEDPFVLNPSNDVFDMSGEPETWRVYEYSPERTNGFYKMDSIRFRDDTVIQFNVAGEPTEVFFCDSPRTYEYNRRTGKLISRSFKNVPNGCPLWCYVAEWPSPKGVQVIIYETTSMVPETDD